MRVLVTGANGYIGSHVVKALLNMGHDVYAADIAFNNLDERVKKITESIFDVGEDAYEKFMSPDVCIHMAWRNGFVHNADSHITDLPKHYMFIKNMIKGGLKHIVVMGTMHEIGYWEGAIEENTPANPESNYGIAKNTLRQLAMKMASDNDVCLQWLRAYYITGDDKKSNSIFAKIIKAAEEGKTTFPFTMGKNKYDFISVYELAQQIASAATQTEVTGAINCCTGNPMSLAERVEKFIKDEGLNIKLEYGKFPDRPYDSPGVWGDATKINIIMKNRAQ